MPTFTYIAKDSRGKRVEGKISAQNERELFSQVAAQDQYLVSIVSEDARAATSSTRISGQVMATTYGQLSSLLRSGVPLLRSIGLLRDQTSNKKLKQILSDIYRKVEEGVPLHEAVARYPNTFDEIAVQMIRAGAEGAFLEDALERIAKFTEGFEDLKSRTIGALAYPVLLGTIGTLIVTGLIIFVVPYVGEMFDRLREEGQLPWITEALLAVSDTLRKYGLIWLLIAFGVGYWARSRLATEQGRNFVDKWKTRIPLIGPVFLNLAVARFCRVLGTLLKNGVPIVKSLDISRQATANRMLSRAIAKATENISAGQSLARPLAASGHFPGTVVEIISVAEEANTLDRVLVELADDIEKKTSRNLDTAVKLLEPIMLLVLASMVLGVVIALLVPIIRMSSTV